MKKASLFGFLAVVLCVGMVSANSVFAASPTHTAGTAITSGGGGVPWVNPEEVTTPGAPRATVALSAGQTSEKIEATNFGFSVPVGATINGIKVTVNRRSSAGNTNTAVVRLMKNGSVVGENKATGAAWPTSFANVNYGNGSDLWNTTWTPAQINAANFGVALSAENTSAGNRNLSVDSIEITVNYTPDTTAPILSSPIAITTPTKDNTPNFTFTSDEAGTISYGGSCTSVETNGVVGSKTVTLSTLADGTYSDCTVTVTDEAGNASNTLAIDPFTVDTVDPVLTEVTAIATPSINTTPTYEFNSTEVGTITYLGSCISAAAVNAVIGTNTVTFDPMAEGTYTNCRIRVRDAALNLSAALHIPSFTIDLTAPIIDPILPMTVEATSSAGATVTFTASATDAVDGTTDVVVCIPASGTTFALGTTTVTCNTSDAAGNAAVPTPFDITVVDTTAPDITGLSNVSAEGNAVGGATLTFSYSATDLVDGATPVDCVPGTASLFPVGTTPVVCTSTDAHSNTATVNFNVIISDTTSPTILILPGNMTKEATSSAGATAAFTATALDIVDGTADVVTCSKNSGDTFALGITTVTCDTSDVAGNPAAQGSFTVTVVDTTAPTIDTQVDLSAEATSPLGALVSFTAPMSHDAVDGDQLSSCDQTAGTFSIGVTTVTCTKTDANLNVATSEVFTITVVDTTAPVSNVTAPVAASKKKGTITITANASDIASNVARVEFWHASTGTLIGTDTTAPYSMDWDTITEGVVDGGHDIWVVACDNAVPENCAPSAVVTITVDNTAPVITLTGQANMLLMPGATYNEAGATALDAIDGDITASIVEVNPLNTTFPGTYTLTYNVIDAAGNAAAQVTRTVVIFTRGGGGSGTIGGGSGSTPAPTAVVGQVLGVEDFRFALSHKKGAKHDDIKELQDRLRKEGFFTLPTSTNYFGMATFNALKAWQKAHNLPATGFFGPMSIAEMNK